jgi:hypothetical protein
VAQSASSQTQVAHCQPKLRSINRNSSQGMPFLCGVGSPWWLEWLSAALRLTQASDPCLSGAQGHHMCIAEQWAGIPTFPYRITACKLQLNGPLVATVKPCPTATHALRWHCQASAVLTTSIIFQEETYHSASLLLPDGCPSPHHSAKYRNHQNLQQQRHLSCVLQMTAVLITVPRMYCGVATYCHCLDDDPLFHESSRRLSSA